MSTHALGVHADGHRRLASSGWRGRARCSVDEVGKEAEAHVETLGRVDAGSAKLAKDAASNLKRTIGVQGLTEARTPCAEASVYLALVHGDVAVARGKAGKF